MSLTFSALLAGIVAMSSPSDIERPENLGFREAVEQGYLSASLKTRYEDVNEERGGGDIGAQATTARIRVAYETERYHFFSGLVEYTGNIALAGDDNYFDGSNGEFDDALIADPELSFLSRYWLGYDVSNTLVKYGRQRVTLDNGRFLGADEFRQASSSVRGVTLRNQTLNFLTLRAGNLNHFNSPLYKDVPGSSEEIDYRYFNAEYSGIIHSHLSFYSYQSGSPTKATLWDTQTDGVRFSGHIKNEPEIDYAFEIARQKDRNNNPNDYSVRYSLAELGMRYSGLRVAAGHESLGANRGGYFVTPFASLHEFQGWSDVFTAGGLGNIAGGISDHYASLGYRFEEGFEADLTFHQFESEHKTSGPGKLGKEYNAAITYSYAYFSCALRYADYHARNFGSDTRKAWVEFELSY